KGFQYLPHLGRGEIVQWQPADDPVVASLAAEVLEPAMEQLRAVTGRPKIRLAGEPLVEMANEIVVEFDQRQAVVGPQQLHEPGGDSPRARPDLENIARPAIAVSQVTAKRLDQRSDGRPYHH